MTTQKLVHKYSWQHYSQELKDGNKLNAHCIRICTIWLCSLMALDLYWHARKYCAASKKDEIDLHVFAYME